MADLRIVDGVTLPGPHRDLLRPGELVRGSDGRRRRLPRWFFEVPSWEVALEADLAPHFRVWEFLNVDVREHELQRLHWPRYLPLAVGALAAVLEVLRVEVDTYVHIAANGGYRSPGHRLAGGVSPHSWGTAANLYRIGDDWLDDERGITRYGRLVRSLSPVVWTRPFGQVSGTTDDHLHVDLGFTVVAPHQAEDGVHGAGDGTATRDPREA
jgi:hypothetical protein